TGGTASGCSITDGILSFTSTGACIVTVGTANSTNFSDSCDAATFTLTFTAGTQAVSLGTSSANQAFSSTPADNTYDLSALDPSTTGTDGTTTFTYTVTGGTASGCSIT